MVGRTNWGVVQHTATHCKTHKATHCNTRTATHCNTHYPRRMARPHHLTHTNAACHMYKWIIADIQMCHVQSLNTRDTDRHRDTQTQRHLHRWHPLHMQMAPVAHANWHPLHMQMIESESCHTCEWVMSHICMSHHTYDWDIETYQTSEITIRTWVMSHMWMSHVTHMHESSHIWHINAWDHNTNMIRHTFVHVINTRSWGVQLNS